MKGIDEMDNGFAVEVRPGVRMAYRDHWFGVPWRRGVPVVMLHGVAESSEAWREWVPALAGRLRVIRPDLPGFGRSSAPATYSWTPAELAADVVKMLDTIGIDRFHLIGAKYGGSVSLQLAADYPYRVISLAVLGSPAKGNTGGRAKLGAVSERIREVGVRGWAAESQPSRLGPEVSAEQSKWWTDELMGKADPRACAGASNAVAGMNLEDRCADITAPALVVTTDDSPLQPIAAARAYQERIPNSRLLVLPSACYHIAAVRPRECAQHVLEFIESVRNGTPPG